MPTVSFNSKDEKMHIVRTLSDENGTRIFHLDQKNTNTDDSLDNMNDLPKRINDFKKNCKNCKGAAFRSKK